MYDPWVKSLSQAGAATEWIPFLMMVNETAPKPLLSGNFMYLAADQGVVKVDLSTGKTAWESPDYDGLDTNLDVLDGRVLGSIGYIT